MLREDDPRSPVPYLLVRGLRWGEVRARVDGIDPQLLEAPTPEDRRRLRSFFLDEQWEELLAASEEVMASEAGRGWLDLQRYSILAADKLGKEYRPVASALRGALKLLLEDLPSLAEATLMDDSSSASSETLAWLKAAGFVESGETGDPLPGEDTDPDQVRREASFERAQKMVQGGDPDGAIRLLMRRGDVERSERARFITRAEAAAIMVSRGELVVARPILDELLKEVDQHNLEDWEAGETVARPLGLLYRCLDPSEGPIRQQIYQRICRLDPLLARSIGEAGRG
ncbi:MAG: type VI secretion system domain-containing protein [Longimicrobiales bacterium]|nr:type VI secretion system domain-containing protein [Longimicrobiales bacterium]